MATIYSTLKPIPLTLRDSKLKCNPHFPSLPCIKSSNVRTKDSHFILNYGTMGSTRNSFSSSFRPSFSNTSLGFNKSGSRPVVTTVGVCGDADNNKSVIRPSSFSLLSSLLEVAMFAFIYVLVLLAGTVFLPPNMYLIGMFFWLYEIGRHILLALGMFRDWTARTLRSLIRAMPGIIVRALSEKRQAKGSLNISMEQHDGSTVVHGEDRETEVFEKSSSDIPNSRSVNIGVEETSETQGTTQVPWEEAFSKLDKLTEQVSRLVGVMNVVDQDFCDRIYSEVMELEGSDEVTLTKAFEYLTENPLVGRQFLSKSAELRIDWLTTFASQRH